MSLAVRILWMTLVVLCVATPALVRHGLAEPLTAPALHRGINLSSWLANAPRQPLYSRDFAQIAQVGFDHVRLPFNPEYYGFRLSQHQENAGSIDFVALDRAIALAEQYHLRLILDLHPSGEFETTLERHRWAEDDFVALWTTIADHYKQYPATDLIFEILNEPQYYKSERLWSALSARAIKAIHAVSADRVIIIGAPHGSEIDGLKFLTPKRDPTLIYSFHFYEPYIVTHQGIHMGFEDMMIRSFHQLPYPSSLATEPATRYAPNALNSEQAKEEFSAYVQTPWNDQHVRERIEQARIWASTNGVRVVCGEYGVLRNHIDVGSRYRWIKDVRAALDADGMGWELWDYADLFGITTPIGPTTTDKVDGSVRLDDPEKSTRAFEPEALEALGLGVQP